jgi:hypothetical protein
MSEEKVIQHAGNAVRVLRDKEKGWVGKLKEFFFEMLIIFFAVTITLLFHNWNDSLREHRQEREFLTGIKSDLDSGVVAIDRQINSFQPTLNYFINVRQQFATHQFNTAYLDTNSWALTNTNYLNFDMGRFDGFQSSGYLRLIENQTLLKHLMSLYTISIPFQINADRMVFDSRRQYFEEHIGAKGTFDLDYPGYGRLVASKLTGDPEFRYFVIYYAAYLDERKGHKQDLIRQMKKLSAEIGDELNK